MPSRIFLYLYPYNSTNFLLCYAVASRSYRAAKRTRPRPAGGADLVRNFPENPVLQGATKRPLRGGERTKAGARELASARAPTPGYRSWRLDRTRLHGAPAGAWPRQEPDDQADERQDQNQQDQIGRA